MKKLTPLLLPCILLLFVLLPKVCRAQGPVVNVALQKPVSANVTCGTSGPEQFISQAYAGSQTAQNVQVCLNQFSYPASAIVDGNDNNWWQSASRIVFNNLGYGVNGRYDAEIGIDLLQTFSVQSVLIRFGESLRPGRMIFYRKVAPAVTFSPWFYRVTNGLDCTNIFNVPLLSVPYTSNAIPCTAYTTVPTLNETVIFDYSTIPATSDAKAWTQISSLRIEFYNIDLTLGLTSGAIAFQHYTVRSVELMAQCSCNGMQTDCVLNNGSYQCVCGGNTAGSACEICLPLYNNQPYQYGVPCQACQCNSHAISCIYVASLNKGFCINCANYTTGDNCEKCAAGYYRPTGVNITNPSPCFPCNCSGIAVRPDQACLNNVADQATYPTMNPGDCFCQPNVVGPKCLQCNVGYYGFSSSGCTACLCNTAGTVGASPSCNGTGYCPCKPSVIGIYCDTCIDGYYGLDANNPNGCTVCNCDIGGSSSSICNKLTGICSCKLNIGDPTDRTCSMPKTGFYYPSFQYIYSEMETLNLPWQNAVQGYSGFGYVTAQNQLPVSTTLTVPSMYLGSSLSDNYQIVARYSSPATTTAIFQSGINNQMTSTSGFSLITCAQTFCFSPVGFASIPKGQSVQISYLVNTTTGVLFDKTIAIPIEYFNVTNIFGPTESQNFQTTCHPMDNTQSTTDTYCTSRANTIAGYYFNKAFPCSCFLQGSTNTTSCAQTGGQCSCNAGVMLRDCSQCLYKYYSMISSCLPCNCTSTGYNMCDQYTGSCLCPPGAQGTNCNACLPNYYNWNPTQGCQPCLCNAVGASSPVCNFTTGMCSCKAGVTGARCDQCGDGYYNLNYYGCTACGCNSAGSLSAVCDKSTGNCPCKKNVGGQACTTCSLSSFSMSSSYADGCLQCICMGVSTTCSQASWQPIIMYPNGFLTPIVNTLQLVLPTTVNSNIPISYNNPGRNGHSVLIPLLCVHA